MTMTRPFTDAETEEMPELRGAKTMPMRVANYCGWCDIRLSAIPDAPREWHGRYYHPGGCISAARGAARGEVTVIVRGEVRITHG